MGKVRLQAPLRPVWSRGTTESTLMAGAQERGRLSEYALGSFYLSLWLTDDPDEVAISGTFDATSIAAAEKEGMRRYVALMKRKVEVADVVE